MVTAYMNPNSLTFNGIIFFLLLITLLSFKCYSDTNDNNKSLIESAFFILSNTDVLYINDIEQAEAFFIILKDKNATNIFLDLLQESKTGVGIFYALLGLFERNKDYYIKSLGNIDLNKEIVVKSIRSADFALVSTIMELQIVIENNGWMENLREVIRSVASTNSIK